MKKIIYSTLIISGIICCNPKLDFSKIVPSNIDKFATDYMVETRKGNIDSCLNLMSDELKNG